MIAPNSAVPLNLNKMKISFSPPFIDKDIKREVSLVLDSGWITTGPKVKMLEQEIASICGLEACLGVNSATSALMLVLHWWGVKPGDEIIIPAYTYCATALACLHLGAKVVMVDIGDDFNIAPEKISVLISEKTKAIITVDFAGWPCDYDSIYAMLASEKVKMCFVPENKNQEQLGRILVLADAAHSLGAIYKNKPSGSLADISVFSFHAVKNITTAEGGMICLNMPKPFRNIDIYQTLRLWSLNGQTKDAFTKTKSGSWKYDIIYPGFKINLPDILAAIGLAQIRKYKTNLLKERKRVFKKYDSIFSTYDWAICPPFHKESTEASYHIYPLRINSVNENQRNRIIEKIFDLGIAVNVHFIPLPLLTVFKEMGYKISAYPLSFLHYSQEISLPIYPQLSNKNCDIVANAVIQAVKEVIAE